VIREANRFAESKDPFQLSFAGSSDGSFNHGLRGQQIPRFALNDDYTIKVLVGTAESRAVPRSFRAES
jgi:hypothetical protein